MMGDTYLNFFKRKRLLVIVPHQDDEINIAGSLIYSLRELAEVHLVFTTNGDYEISGQIRLREALRVSSYMGIPKERCIFLGYGDEPAEEKNILFFDNPVSQAGYSETYALPEHAEFAYARGQRHKKLTRENYKEDLKQIVLELRPEILISNGPDSHPDHYGLYIVLNEVLQEIREEQKYIPAVFRGLAYACAFYGESDYTAFNLLSSKSRNEINQEYIMFEHKKFLWEKRIRLPVHRKARTQLLINNIVYRAMWRYASQSGCRFADRIANSDLVFWGENLEEGSDIWFIKLCVADEYVYTYYTGDNSIRFSVQAYDMNGNVIKVDEKECTFTVESNRHKELLLKPELHLNGRKRLVVHAEYRGMTDCIEVKKYSKGIKCMEKIYVAIDAVFRKLLLGASNCMWKMNELWDHARRT